VIPLCYFSLVPGCVCILCIMVCWCFSASMHMIVTLYRLGSMKDKESLFCDIQLYFLGVAVNLLVSKDS
jgi:hypothetical protein